VEIILMETTTLKKLIGHHSIKEVGKGEGMDQKTCAIE